MALHSQRYSKSDGPAPGHLRSQLRIMTVPPELASSGPRHPVIREAVFDRGHVEPRPARAVSIPRRADIVLHVHRVRRREFISLLGGAVVACPLSARAQQPKMPVIGFLRQGDPPKTFVEAFRQGLRERGYDEGQNVVFEFRFTDGSVDQLPQLAEELVRLEVDVILAIGAPSVLAATKATTSVAYRLCGGGPPGGDRNGAKPGTPRRQHHGSGLQSC
jgi:ABC transporter substrate binding protein